MGDENSNLQEQVNHLNLVIKGFKSLFEDNNYMTIINEQERRIN